MNKNVLLLGYAITAKYEINQLLKMQHVGDVVYPESKVNELKTARSYLWKIIRFYNPHGNLVFTDNDLRVIKSNLCKQNDDNLEENGGKSFDTRIPVDEFSALNLINLCGSAIFEIMQSMSDINKFVKKCCKYATTWINKFIMFVVEQDRTVIIVKNAIWDMIPEKINEYKKKKQRIHKKQSAQLKLIYASLLTGGIS